MPRRISDYVSAFAPIAVEGLRQLFLVRTPLGVNARSIFTGDMRWPPGRHSWRTIRVAPDNERASGPWLHHHARRRPSKGGASDCRSLGGGVGCNDRAARLEGSVFSNRGSKERGTRFHFAGYIVAGGRVTVGLPKGLSL